MITSNLIETGALEQVITNFQKHLLKRSYPELIPLEKLRKPHSLVKNLFLKGVHNKSFPGSAFKTFCKNVGKIDKGSRNFGNCDRTHNTKTLQRSVLISSQIESFMVRKVVEDLWSHSKYSSSVLKNFAIFTGKHLSWVLFLMKRPQHRCFLYILQNFLEQLFL